MPLFPEVFPIRKTHMKDRLHFKITKTLQVPRNCPSEIYKKRIRPETRVPPFTSHAAADRPIIAAVLSTANCPSIAACPSAAARLAGSLTVEAALCLPMFVFFAVALMMPMRWLERQRQVQTVVERTCEELSIYTAVGEFMDFRESENDGGVEMAGQAATGLWLKGKAGVYVEDIIIKNVQVPDNEGNVCLEVFYKEKIPFFHIYPGGITMTAAAKRRSWTGIDGKLGAEDDDNSLGDTDVEMVFVGANMGRYHLYRDCHYISNQYQTVTIEQAEQMRNASGGRYTACSRCAGQGQYVGQVYITQNGEHYHTSKSCSAMVSYVRSVPLNEVEHLGVCSYCARRKGNKS